MTDVIKATKTERRDPATVTVDQGGLLVTGEMLLNHDACHAAVQRFTERFPEGLVVSDEAVPQVVHDFDVNFMYHFLPNNVRASVSTYHDDLTRLGYASTDALRNEFTVNRRVVTELTSLDAPSSVIEATQSRLDVLWNASNKISEVVRRYVDELIGYALVAAFVERASHLDEPSTEVPSPETSNDD